jgi:hypothetical protein
MKKKIPIVIVVCIVLAISFFSGCVNVPEELTQMSIVSFDAEPNIINQGEYVNLSWAVMSASSVNIDNGIGTVALTGHRTIQPTQTTTYTLTASNTTTTMNATVTITVKSIANATISDTMGDVLSVNQSTQETSIVTSHPDINVDNLDIIQATYTQQGTQATISLQVKGNIENRGKIVNPHNADPLDRIINRVEYDFRLTTSEQVYQIIYVNQTGQFSDGTKTNNLTSSDFSIVDDTLSITFPLIRAEEKYENLSVTSMFVKMNLSSTESELAGYVWLSDFAPNPPLSIYDASSETDSGFIRESIQFNANIAPFTGTPPYTDHWDFGDQSSSTQRNPTHTYTKAGHYTYTFTVTDHAGDTDSKTGIITIKP